MKVIELLRSKEWSGKVVDCVLRMSLIHILRLPEQRMPQAGAQVPRARARAGHGHPRERLRRNGKGDGKRWINLSLIHISERSKILPRRTTGTCAMHQRQLTEAIKRARQIALLPFVTE